MHGWASNHGLPRAPGAREWSAEDNWGVGCKILAMRPPSRRAESAIRRNIRLFDAPTFARLCRARDYLSACYRDRITLEKSARQACLSPFHFNRLFTEAFRETPHEFVTRMRIEEAKKLLLAENQRVTDICFDVGYESLGSFSLRFRSLTGLSPAALRREARRTFGGLAAHWPLYYICLLYTSPSPRDLSTSRMPSSA